MTVDTVVLCKFRAACVSKILVEITAFVPCSLMKETEYSGGRLGCFTACDVKHSLAALLVTQCNGYVIGYHLHHVNNKTYKTKTTTTRGQQLKDMHSNFIAEYQLEMCGHACPASPKIVPSLSARMRRVTPDKHCHATLVGSSLVSRLAWERG